MEERRIRVKGIGNIELEPDYIIIYLTIESIQKKYEKAVEEVDKRVDLLKEALLAQGFEADELKCADYKVNANINYKRDHKGFVVNTINDGFCCTNRLKLEFDFDNERLSRALQTITNRVTEPKLNISFTV